ncbi:Serpentine receptor class r-10 [Caenorhabditis elegans]|uniref:Serpentine receptor class r-10 n=1 Tax=Caenorhabditis elegans TaxID=6239 RepID=Q86D26_CAEEL|nr:Seven TM Receptor [Caenorhabditis elegans]CAD60404.1 Seven TM Receptor [Caenorhabditis elegans]|eukprot:NP_506882.2 Seven TM Receptor [Caenorhabditis elegans]
MPARVIFQRFLASLGLLNNAILIILIWKKSPKKLGNYKILMIYIAVFEILYSLLDLLTTPECFSKDSVFLIIINLNSTFVPEFVATCATVAYCSLFGMSLAIFAIHFVYRHLVVEKSPLIFQNHVRKILLLILFTILIGCSWTTSTAYLCGSNIYADEYLTRQYLPLKNLNLPDIKYIGSFFRFPDENGGFHYNWNSFIALSFMLILINLSFLTVFYCGYRIYKTINTLSSISSSAESSLNSQLFWALVFQTIIPVILMHIPACAAFSFSIFDYSFELLGEIPTVTILLYPVLDPLPNFCIIKNYRQAILGFFRCFKPRAGSVQPHTRTV